MLPISDHHQCHESCYCHLYCYRNIWPWSSILLPISDHCHKCYECLTLSVCARGLWNRRRLRRIWRGQDFWPPPPGPRTLDPRLPVPWWKIETKVSGSMPAIGAHCRFYVDTRRRSLARTAGIREILREFEKFFTGCLGKTKLTAYWSPWSVWVFHCWKVAFAFHSKILQEWGENTSLLTNTRSVQGTMRLDESGRNAQFGNAALFGIKRCFGYSGSFRPDPPPEEANTENRLTMDFIRARRKIYYWINQNSRYSEKNGVYILG